MRCVVDIFNLIQSVAAAMRSVATITVASYYLARLAAESRPADNMFYCYFLFYF